MVSDKAFTTDGSSKIYSVDFHIISDNHCNVYINNILQSKSIYDIINNAVVFETTPAAGQNLTIQVGTTPDDLLTTPTEAGIVATNIAAVNTVANNIDDVTSVADNMAEVLLADTNAAAAAASATAAATSETNAATSETNAAASATAAATSETNAATSATNAAASETAASTSATNAATSETNAAASESAASTSATNAGVSETNAAASETAAAGSATAAATSATAAAASETAAATSASDAAASALAASTSEANAATSATNASTSETNAAASATAAQASLDAIEGSYLGVQSSDPTLDLNGDPITIGDWYYNSTTNVTRIYDGTVWQNGAVSTADFVNRNGDTMVGDLTAPSFIGNLDGAVASGVKNGGTTTLVKGTPVYQTSTAGNKAVVEAADASNTSTMPAIGVLAQDLTAGQEVEKGGLIHLGFIQGIDTSTFSEGETIYVASGGGYTNVPPTGEGNLLQNLGKVLKVHASNGSGVVMGAGRSNATPNLNNGNVFIGNASNQSVAVNLDTTVGNLNYLKADGDGSALTGIDALPSQTGHSGKYLGTDGTTASWNTLDTDANSTTKGLYEHSHTISANYSITSGNNALTAGPITINSGVSVTVPTGSTWVIA